MNSKLIVSSSPHVRDVATTSSIMRDVIIAMVPALIASTVIFGVRAALLIAVCVVSCVVFEYLFALVAKKPQTISDLSAVVTGMLLAFNLPPTLPIYMAVIGCFVAIVVVKQLFGGIGCNFANPAIVGRIALMVSFSAPMTNWWVPNWTGSYIHLVSGATPLSLLAQGEPIPDYLTLALGLRGGSLGETCGIALVLGGIYMLVRKVITITTPLTFIGGVAVFSALLGQDPLVQILTGGVLLGAIFMATDYSTSPTTESGKAVFGLGCAILTVVIRTYGAYPEGVSFAILLMNILTPHIDNLTRTWPLGGVKE